MSDSKMMSRGVASNSKVIERIADLYGTPADAFLPTSTGYRNYVYPFLSSNEKLCVIIYKNEPKIVSRIKRANNVSNFLADRDFPARRTIDDRLIKLKTLTGIRHGAIYKYLPGSVIPWEAYTRRHLKLLGSTLAHMHKLLEEYPLEGLPNVEYEMQILTYKMANYFKDEKVSQAMASKLNLKVASQIFKYYQVFHPAIKNLPERQVVHMDFVRGNILFLGLKDSLKISGVLDFEKAAVGHKTFDLARTLAFLYVDSKYKTKQSVFKIFMVSGYLRSGNGSCNKVTFSYKSKKYDLLESLVDFFMLYDFYKFLKHNPYESLGANEHYLRTVSFLIDRRVISSAG